MDQHWAPACKQMLSSLRIFFAASGQAEAAQLGISRALCDIDPSNRPPLKKEARSHSRLRVAHPVPIACAAAFGAATRLSVPR